MNEIIKTDETNYPENINRVIKDFNNLVDALFTFDMEWIFDSLNTSTDIKEYVKRIIPDLFDIGYKIEHIRSLVLGEIIDWKKLSEVEDENHKQK